MTWYFTCVIYLTWVASFSHLNQIGRTKALFNLLLIPVHANPKHKIYTQQAKFLIEIWYLPQTL